MSRLVTTATCASNTSSQSAALDSNDNVPSPTLTNPDMILPYDGERETSTPSPPFDAVRRLERDISQSGFHSVSPQYLHQQQYKYDRDYAHDRVSLRSMSNGNIGMALSLGQEKHASISRGIWDEQHDAAPPLSDIGEEDEDDKDHHHTENNPLSEGSLGGFEDGLQRDYANSSDSRWKGSGELESYDAESSNGSDSTVGTSNGMYKPWPKHGGDRDSKRDHSSAENGLRKDGGRVDNGFEPGNHHAERLNFDSDYNRMSAIVEEEEGSSDDDIKAAERILENAKRRLTHMEDNLSRARSSLRMTPSPAPSSRYSPTPGQQHLSGFARSLHKGDRRAQTSLAGALLRQRAWQEMNASQPSHSRRLSDMHIPSFQSTRQPLESRRPFRSASALASTNASGFGASDAYFEHKLSSTDSGVTYSSPSSPTRVESASHTYSPSIRGNSPLGNAASENSSSKIQKISSMEDFNAVYPSSPPSRAHSQLQVRDLQDQMQGLRSKISNLKVRAQEDSLRRRSLQSLRTPSPFTAAEQWYAGATGYGDGGLKRESIIVQNPSNARAEEEKTENSGETDQVSRTTSSSPVHGNIGELHGDTVTGSPKAPSVAETEDEFEDALTPEDRAALEEILNEPLDSPELLDQDLLEEFPPVPPNPEELRHEDRIDAFDYEHFYLHSILGNFSGGRRDSCSSTDSAETTRPGSSSGAQASVGNRGHKRTHSRDSISTAATFATATEEEFSSEDEECTAQEPTWKEKPAAFIRGKDLPFPQQHLVGRGGTLQSRQTQTRHHTVMSKGYAIVDSPTYPGFVPELNSSTHPVQRYHDNLNGGITSMSMQAQTTLTELVSSLIFLSATSPSSPQHPAVASSLSEEDIALLEPLLRKLGDVCSELLLKSSTSSSRGQQAARSLDDEKAVTRLRRRLETATRVLNGELDV
ncbi:hypothetical protein VTO42DRAFT_1144 [Malbranchea cinnamomea]